MEYTIYQQAPEAKPVEIVDTYEVYIYYRALLSYVFCLFVLWYQWSNSCPCTYQADPYIAELNSLPHMILKCQTML